LRRTDSKFTEHKKHPVDLRGNEGELCRMSYEPILDDGNTSKETSRDDIARLADAVDLREAQDTANRIVQERTIKRLASRVAVLEQLSIKASMVLAMGSSFLKGVTLASGPLGDAFDKKWSDALDALETAIDAAERTE
jgi:hypothetical protein